MSGSLLLRVASFCKVQTLQTPWQALSNEQVTPCLEAQHDWRSTLTITPRHPMAIALVSQVWRVIGCRARLTASTTWNMKPQISSNLSISNLPKILQRCNFVYVKSSGRTFNLKFAPAEKWLQEMADRVRTSFCTHLWIRKCRGSL